MFRRDITFSVDWVLGIKNELICQPEHRLRTSANVPDECFRGPHNKTKRFPNVGVKKRKSGCDFTDSPPDLAVDLDHAWNTRPV